MALAPGSRLGPYEIAAQIGVGGMGEVYRAADTNLGRDVAIKVLPDAFAQDADRLARFEREAKMLASINHPNIAIIHGLEKRLTDSGQSIRALVMELVEGPTLADAIVVRATSSKPGLPVDEAIAVARQISDALEAAHGQGIVHRDLKPANIKLRPDGVAKVLDFGLAKALEPSGPSVSDGRTVGIRSDVAQSPTITTPAMTVAGMILGTAAYMSPEQAKGRPADKRSDIWAFGCVLYEMLTGKRAFEGEDVGDTLAAVIRGEPDWSALPSDLPASIRLLLRRCLEKDLRARISDMSVARFVMTESAVALNEPSIASDDTSARRSPASDLRRELTATMRKRTVGAVALGALTGVALTVLVGWVVARRMLPHPPDPARFAIVLPSTHVLDNSVAQDLAISPNASHIVYVATVEGRTQLAMRAIGELEARLLAGTEGASSPFFSNDGRWIGFFTSVGGGGGELKKVPIGGGAATALCRYTGNAAGASWGSDDSIVFATTDLTTGLFRVPAAGGQPKALTTPDRSRGEIDHRFPLVLPGANAVVYSLANADNYHLATLDLDTGQQRLLIPGRNAQYSDSGHLVYAVDQTLHAIRFDLDSLQVNGEPVPVLQDVRLSQAVLAATDFSVSRNGALVYVPGAASQPEAPRSLVWVTRKGTEEPINAPPRAYVIARISPDGGKVALDVREQQADIYIWDLERESFSRLTTDQRNDRNPLWMPDGERIVFASNRGAGSLSLFWQRADGIGQAERLATANGFMVPTSVSPDGKRIAVMENLDITVFSTEPRAATGAAPAQDSSALPKAESERRSAPLLATAFNEDNAEISPNGEWLAYQLNEAGQPQIYVRSFPDVNRFRMQVTTAGGRTPAWSRDGRELFYLDANNRLTSVQVQTGKTFGAGKPITVLTKAYYPGFGNRSYDVSPDGQRFLMIKETAVERPTAAPAGFVVVLNWQEELNRLVPR